DDAQRDRNPEAAVHDLVEVAVTGVVVLFRVAAETLLLAEEPREPLEHLLRRGVEVRLDAQFASELVEALDVVLDRELRILLFGDEQDCEGEVDALFAPFDQAGEEAPGRNRIAVYHCTDR